MMKIIERYYGPPRPRVERMLVADAEVAGYLSAEGRWTSIRAVAPESLPANLRVTIEALAECGQGHVEYPDHP